MSEGTLGFPPTGASQVFWQPISEFPLPPGEEFPALTELQDRAARLRQTS